MQRDLTLAPPPDIERKMHISGNTELLAWLAALAGAVHVLAPDHWVPASILSWQKGWRLRRSIVFAVALFSLHVAGGVLVYDVFDAWVAEWALMNFLLFTTGLVLLFTFIRSMRFPRVREVFHAGPHGAWGIFAVLSILGPCESVIPVLIKAKQLGTGYFIPFAAFLAGTLAAAVAMMLVGRAIWNRPLLLPRGLHAARRVSALIPVTACLVLGLSVLLRI